MISIEDVHPKNAELGTFPRLHEDWLSSDSTHNPTSRAISPHFAR
jgi:hypothetical protein